MNPFFGSLPTFVTPLPPYHSASRSRRQRLTARGSKGLGWLILVESALFALIALAGEALAIAP